MEAAHLEAVLVQMAQTKSTHEIVAPGIQISMENMTSAWDDIMDVYRFKLYVNGFMWGRHSYSWENGFQVQHAPTVAEALYQSALRKQKKLWKSLTAWGQNPPLPNFIPLMVMEVTD